MFVNIALIRLICIYMVDMFLYDQTFHIEYLIFSKEEIHVHCYTHGYSMNNWFLLVFDIAVNCWFIF